MVLRSGGEKEKKFWREREIGEKEKIWLLHGGYHLRRSQQRSHTLRVAETSVVRSAYDRFKPRVFMC